MPADVQQYGVAAIANLDFKNLSTCSIGGRTLRYVYPLIPPLCFICVFVICVQDVVLCCPVKIFMDIHGKDAVLKRVD